MNDAAQPEEPGRAAKSRRFDLSGVVRVLVLALVGASCGPGTTTPPVAAKNANSVRMSVSPRAAFMLSGGRSDVFRVATTGPAPATLTGSVIRWRLIEVARGAAFISTDCVSGGESLRRTSLEGTVIAGPGESASGRTIKGGPDWTWATPHRRGWICWTWNGQTSLADATEIRWERLGLNVPDLEWPASSRDSDAVAVVTRGGELVVWSSAEERQPWIRTQLGTEPLAEPHRVVVGRTHVVAWRDAALSVFTVDLKTGAVRETEIPGGLRMKLCVWRSTGEEFIAVCERSAGAGGNVELLRFRTDAAELTVTSLGSLQIAGTPTDAVLCGSELGTLVIASGSDVTLCSVRDAAD